MSTATDRVAVVHQLAERLAELVTLENQLLADRRPREIADLQDEKLRLSESFQAEMDAVRRDPAILGAPIRKPSPISRRRSAASTRSSTSIAAGSFRPKPLPSGSSPRSAKRWPVRTGPRPATTAAPGRPETPVPCAAAAPCLSHSIRWFRRAPAKSCTNRACAKTPAEAVRHALKWRQSSCERAGSRAAYRPTTR